MSIQEGLVLQFWICTLQSRRQMNREKKPIENSLPTRKKAEEAVSWNLINK